ncbi:MAG: hypothetical protein U0105_07440 [Candidatus Obscuribacterales bacterium]
MSNQSHPEGPGLPESKLIHPEQAPLAISGGDLLAVGDTNQMNGVLQCFRDMEKRPGFHGSTTDPFKVEDWSNINAATTYGVVNDGGGYSINQIPGIDGETYSYRFNRVMDGISQHVYKQDAFGNDIEVTDQRVLMEISRKANLIHRVDASQQLLSTKTDEQKEMLDKMVMAVKADDIARIVNLLTEYVQSGSSLKDCGDAFEAAATVRNAGASFVFQPNTDSDTLTIKYRRADGDEREVEVTMPKQQ